MKNQLNNTIFTIFFLLIIFLLSCKLSTQLSMKKVNDNFLVRYTLLYNNRKANHKPVSLYVSVDTLNTRDINHYYYLFSLNSNTVTKFHSYMGRRENFTLATDSKNNGSNDKLFPLTKLDSEIFDKIIYFSDSLKLKDFLFLKKAKGFKISSQKS